MFLKRPRMSVMDLLFSLRELGRPREGAARCGRTGSAPCTHQGSPGRAVFCVVSAILIAFSLFAKAPAVGAGAETGASAETTKSDLSDVPVTKMQGLGEVHYQLLRAKELDHDYHLFVRLPTGHDSTSEVVYPTLYLLDGGVTFPLLASYYQYLRAGEEVPDLVIVGISYGNNDWGTGNLRGHDYTAPAESREHYGGSAAFRTFLSKEVFPLVEGKFPSDPDRRMVFGQSIGGQFVIDTAQSEPEMFWGYIASNPALHRNLEHFLRPLASADGGATTENQSGEPAPAPRPGLFVASGSLDQARFREPALRWMEHWNLQATRGRLPWQLQTVTLEGESHMSAAPASFRRGIAWLMNREEDP